MLIAKRLGVEGGGGAAHVKKRAALSVGTRRDVIQRHFEKKRQNKQ